MKQQKALKPQELRNLLFSYCNTEAHSEKMKIENEILAGCRNLIFTFCQNIVTQNAYVTEEILQEGTLGFWKALQRCDKDQIEKGFVSYAKKYVLAHVLKYLENAPLIPYWRRTWEHEVIREIRKWEKKKTLHKGDLWSVRLSEDYELHDFIESLLPKLVRRSRKTITFEEVHFVCVSYLKGSQIEISNSFTAFEPNSYEISKEDLEYIRFILENSGLSERQISIIERRYLSGNDEQITMKSIGEEQGVTREAIRQIEERAILKMRNTHKQHMAYLEEEKDVISEWGN